MSKDIFLVIIRFCFGKEVNKLGKKGKMPFSLFLIVTIMTLICMLISFFAIKEIGRSIFMTQHFFHSATFYIAYAALFFYFISLKQKYKHVDVIFIAYIGILFSLIVLAPAFFLKVSKGIFWFKKYADYLYFPAYTMLISLTSIGAIFPFLPKKDSLKEISLRNKLNINGVIFIVLIIVFAIEKFFNIRF